MSDCSCFGDRCDLHKIENFEKLVEALRFYANEDSWIKSMVGFNNVIIVNDSESDELRGERRHYGGKLARQTLKEIGVKE